MPSFDLKGHYNFTAFGQLSETIELMSALEKGKNLSGFNIPTLQQSCPSNEVIESGYVLVHVRGIILQTREPALDTLGVRYTAVDSLIRELCNIVKRYQDLLGIICLVDSDGGAPKACQELAYLIRQLSHLKHVQTLVVGSMLNGAMLVGLSAGPGKVYAAVPLCRFGSVGVILRYKERTSSDDPGYIIREERCGFFKCAEEDSEKTSEIQEYLDSQILFLYDTFCEDLASFRNMSVDDVRAIADGRVFSAQKAIDLGLCDGFINLLLWHLSKEIAPDSTKNKGRVCKNG